MYHLNTAMTTKELSQHFGEILAEECRAIIDLEEGVKVKKSSPVKEGFRPKSSARIFADAAKKTPKEVIDAAHAAGHTAFHAGKTPVPAHDPAVSELMKKHNGHALGILDGWTKGWHKANLAGPVK